MVGAQVNLTFDTIFPGCYAGRMPHIHVEVYPSAVKATGFHDKIATTQFALDVRAHTAVYASEGYGHSHASPARLTYARDNAFGDNSDEELAGQTIVTKGSPKAGYSGTVTVTLGDVLPRPEASLPTGPV